MTLRQEAHAMIDSLPDDDSVKFFIDLCSQGKVDGYIAFHSLSIIWYSLRIPDEFVTLFG